MEELHSLLLSVRGRGSYNLKVYLKGAYCWSLTGLQLNRGSTEL